jgi:hypothetical protein
MASHLVPFSLYLSVFAVKPKSLTPCCRFCQIFTLAQATPTPTPSPTPQIEIVQPQQVRAIPGKLDDVPVFNSNSPELVQTEGILLSTFPPNGKATQLLT